MHACLHPPPVVAGAHPPWLPWPIQAIDVEVAQGPGLPYRMVHVVIDYTQVDSKPVLGGYRNKRSGAVYHHSATQTPKTPKYDSAAPKMEREVQTKNNKATSQQTVREAATQMARPGVLLDENNDRCARMQQGILWWCVKKLRLTAL
jgi:hypothetical protein